MKKLFPSTLVFIVVSLLFYFFLPFYSGYLKSGAKAEEAIEYKIQIQNHQFRPNQLTVAANHKIKLIIENLDKTVEEFESHDLNREKLVMGGKQIILLIEPLKAGEYKYFGDFHPRTAQGIIIAK